MRYWYIIAGLLVFAVIANVWAQNDDDDDEDSSEFGNKNIPGEKTTTCECGWANKEDQRIVGGKETKVNEYPMMAGIIYKVKKILFCGGTVISQYHVITAAHCTEPFEDEPELMNVVLGEHDQEKVDESDSTVYMEVKDFTPHPDYYLVGHRHDLSIINLKEKIQFSNTIGPACLPIARHNFVGDKLKVLGWGKLSQNGPTSKVLMKVYLNVVKLEMCSKHYEYIDLIDNRQVCTYHPTKDSCQGDSGGPLLWLDPEINRYVLAAATSYGHACADSHSPAVNTDISYYLPWIRQVIAETRPDAAVCTKKN